MSVEYDENSVPEPGDVVIIPGVGCRRYLVLEQHGRLRSGWCMCDLMNTETGAVFRNHSFQNVMGVSKPTKDELKLFTKHHLGIPTH